MSTKHPTFLESANRHFSNDARLVNWALATSFNDTLISQGCDPILYLNLTIGQKNPSETNQSQCSAPRCAEVILASK